MSGLDTSLSISIYPGVLASYICVNVFCEQLLGRRSFPVIYISVY